MSISTFLMYLIGLEAAIRDVAHNPWSIGIGFIFVLTAGIARSYRKHDLRRRPAFLLLPLAASLTTSLLLYLLICAVMALGGASLLNHPTYESRTLFGAWLRGYGSFLGLFWMTAPLAWLYGIPFERWIDNRLKAVKTRLWCLGLVSLWRMALMVRVLVVLLECSTSAAVFMVMLFGDLVAVAALLMVESSAPEKAPELLTGMGGIGPTAPAEDELLNSVRGCVLGLGILTGLVWLIGTLNAAGSSGSWFPLPQVSFAAPHPTTGLLAFTIGSLLAWSLFLIPAQRRQRLRTRIETLVENRELDASLAEMSHHQPADFPDHWMPPPSGNFVKASNHRILLDIIECLSIAQPPRWVREAYLKQFDEYLDEAMWYWFDDQTFTRVAEVLSRFPEGPHLAERSAKAIDRLFEEATQFSFEMFEKQEVQEEKLPPFPVSDDQPGQDIWSSPEWPRDTIERRKALAKIRALASQAASSEGRMDRTFQEGTP